MAGMLEGLPIVDAEDAMDLHVQKRDIKRTAAKDPGHCALAECMKREYGEQDVRVYLSRAYVLHGDHWVRYTVSALAQREITAFDRGGSFEPGLYRLYAPSPSSRLDYSKKKQPPRPGFSTQRPRAIPQITANVRPRSAVVANAGLHPKKDDV
jgi:hypothetical protein